MPVNLDNIPEERVGEGKFIETDDDLIFNLDMDCWRGQKVSDMVWDFKGRQVLKWVLRNNFQETHKEFIRMVLDEALEGGNV